MFNTALTLTEDQLQRMVRHVRTRIESLESARTNGWLADRERFEREWNDDFSHRQSESVVFANSNESLNMVGSGVDFIRARIMDEIFGSAPWFLAEPRNASGHDPLLASQVTKHLRWKLGPDQIGFQEVSGDLLTQACKLGECVAKVCHKTDSEVFERLAMVLWDERANAPVLNADGEPILQECGAIPTESCCWMEQIVSERVVRYTGAKAVPLHYKEFYCPLDAPSIHESDFVAHMTSMRLSELCGHFGIALDAVNPPGPIDHSQPDVPSEESYLTRALRRIQRGCSTPKLASGQPLPGEGKETPPPEPDPEFRVAEAYFRFDARGDGQPCRVFLMVAYDFDVPIFWDYIANVTPRGRYPFEALAINKEPHRWYGKSWFKKFEKFQRLIDKLLKQILYRNELAAKPVKFRRKEAVLQWQDDQPFEIGPDKVFDLNDGYTAEDALQTAKIPELDAQTKFLLETVIANWRTRSGVATATQGEFAGLPAERTATGINQIVSSGTALLRPLILDTKRGLEAVLRQLIEYQYAFQEEDETFSCAEGNVRVLETLIADRVRELEFDVELTLTRAKQARSLDSAKLAVDFFGKFLALPDAFKPVAAPLFTTVYKSLEIDNADDYFQQIVAIARREPGSEAVSADAVAGTAVSDSAGESSSPV